MQYRSRLSHELKIFLMNTIAIKHYFTHKISSYYLMFLTLITIANTETLHTQVYFTRFIVLAQILQSSHCHPRSYTVYTAKFPSIRGYSNQITSPLIQLRERSLCGCFYTNSPTWCFLKALEITNYSHYTRLVLNASLSGEELWSFMDEHYSFYGWALLIFHEVIMCKLYLTLHNQLTTAIANSYQ